MCITNIDQHTHRYIFCIYIYLQIQERERERESRDVQRAFSSTLSPPSPKTCFTPESPLQKNQTPSYGPAPRKDIPPNSMPNCLLPPKIAGGVAKRKGAQSQASRWPACWRPGRCPSPPASPPSLPWPPRRKEVVNGADVIGDVLFVFKLKGGEVSLK